MTSIGGEGRPLQLYNDEIETYSEWIAWLEPAFPMTVFLPSFLPYIRYGSPGSGLFPRIPLLRAEGQENGIARNRITRHVVVAATKRDGFHPSNRNRVVFRVEELFLRSDMYIYLADI